MRNGRENARSAVGPSRRDRLPSEAEFQGRRRRGVPAIFFCPRRENSIRVIGVIRGPLRSCSQSSFPMWGIGNATFVAETLFRGSGGKDRQPKHLPHPRNELLPRKVRPESPTFGTRGIVASRAGLSRALPPQTTDGSQLPPVRPGPTINSQPSTALRAPAPPSRRYYSGRKSAHWPPSAAPSTGWAAHAAARPA